MVNVDPLTAETGCRVWAPQASLLHRRRSTDVNQTLLDVWPSAGLVRYIYIFRGSWPWGILPGATFTLRSRLALSYIGSVTARHWSSGREPNFAAWYKEWN